MMKTRQDNDLIDCISTIYVENDAKLLGPIGLGAFCDIKTRQDNSVTNCTDTA